LGETNEDILRKIDMFTKDPPTIMEPKDKVYAPRASAKAGSEVELDLVIGQTLRYLDSLANASKYLVF
jgi:2-keto-4-pentenoate hydratase/2-oxohepta-3-ene-1,7-dioic acid hydratase in catechol pathway